MADILDVVTLAEAKKMLSIGQIDQTDDPNLVRLITAASRRLDKLCGPVVQRTVAAERHTGEGDHWSIELHSAPVASITSVIEDGVTLPADDYDMMPYRPDPTLLDGFLMPSVCWLYGARIEVTYVAGRYADTETVAADFKEAAALMLRNFWRGYSESIGQVNEYDVPVQNFPTFAIPQAVRELLHAELKPEIGFGA